MLIAVLIAAALLATVLTGPTAGALLFGVPAVAGLLVFLSLVKAFNGVALIFAALIIALITLDLAQVDRWIGRLDPDHVADSR